MLHRRGNQAHAGLAVGLAIGAAALATPAAADVRFIAFDPANDLTRSLTQGVTLEVDRGWFGRVDVRRLYSTGSRGSAGLDKAANAQARAVLPTGSSESDSYQIETEGDGRALANALCPGSTETWLVMGKPRLARPLTVHAVGRWSDGQWRHCARLSYQFRGEWAEPPRDGPADSTPPGR
ncbi:hypothetical protein [Brevundimonas lutea]|uniref:hypothetical protein n=1 Tax=Brevundimonas lutea TaxID=2293980 RepID=UPI001F0CC88D|nr:hypothetical protein [Brevundimonas lutea]